MEEVINSKFVDTITALFPTKKECIDFISTTLSIGTSSAKRRVNKKVFFSYADVVILTQELKISLDSLQSTSNLSIDLFLKNIKSDPSVLSKNILMSHLKLYESLDSIKNASLNIACNVMPYSSVVKYDNIYKYYIYKMYFQNRDSIDVKTFSELEISGDQLSLRKKLVAQMEAIGTTTIVFDRHFITEIVDDILYLKDLDLLNKNDLLLLENDMKEFIHDLEIICSTGKNKQDNIVNLYISDISIEASCAYIETSKSRYSLVRLHSLNTMITENTLFCAMQKTWTNSIKKYSTLISKSGVLEKKMFFHQQKAYCKKITL